LSGSDLDSCKSTEPLGEDIVLVGETSDNAFNADVANACVKAAGAYNCRDNDQVQALCLLVFSGHAAIGQPCALDSDCAQSPGMGAVCPLGVGICTRAGLVGRDGAPCWGVTARNGASVECAFYDGFLCLKDSSSPTGMSCRHRSPPQGSCDVLEDNCQSGYTCSANVCVPEPGLGAGCSGTCAFPYNCNDGYCTKQPAGTCLSF
jgi:hypothetical protein